MKKKELAERLDRIQESVSAKGHMMQDYSTVKMAILDLIAVVRELVKQGGRDAED